MVYSCKIPLPVPAQEVGEYLEQLEARDGCVTALSLLNESRAEDAPLHKCFEWDDSKAAEKYRLHQARAIIANITIAVPDSEVKPRGFVAVTKYRSPGRFVSVSRAMTTPDMRAQVLRNAISELLNFRRKYSELQELAELFTFIDKLAV